MFYSVSHIDAGRSYMAAVNQTMDLAVESLPIRGHVMTDDS